MSFSHFSSPSFSFPIPCSAFHSFARSSVLSFLPLPSFLFPFLPLYVLGFLVDPLWCTVILLLTLLHPTSSGLLACLFICLRSVLHIGLEAILRTHARHTSHHILIFIFAYSHHYCRHLFDLGLSYFCDARKKHNDQGNLEKKHWIGALFIISQF